MLSKSSELLKYSFLLHKRNLFHTILIKAHFSNIITTSKIFRFKHMKTDENINLAIKLLNQHKYSKNTS
jgi:hypothetical protein